MNRLYEILQSCRPDVDYETETALVDNGLLESLDIVMLVGMLTEEYSVRIRMDDLIPENFNSAAAIYALVKRLQEGA